jgi:hypothetical protein
MLLCRSDQTEVSAQGISPIDRSRKHKILSSNHKGLDLLLVKIVIHLKSTIV